MRDLIKKGELIEKPTKPYDKKRDFSVSGASLDLCLGEQVFVTPNKTPSKLGKNEIINIHPGQFAALTTEETLRIPTEFLGFITIRFTYKSKGLVNISGFHVDPGFKGKLFCLLFNTSNAPVFLKRGQHYATLEFHKLLEPTDPYKGKYQAKTGIVDYLPSNTLKGAVNELKKELEEVKSQGQGLQTTILGMLSILLAIIALLLALR